MIRPSCAAVTIACCAAVDVMRISAPAASRSHASNSGTARPPSSAASAAARSGERFATANPAGRTPRESSARAVRSPVSPAPSTSARQRCKSPKSRSAKSTAADATDTVPRPISVSRTHLFGRLKRALKKLI